MVISCIALLLVLADLGPIGPASMTIGGLLTATLLPVTAPYSILAMAAIQDAPGQAGIWWYVGVVLLGIIIIAHEFPAIVRLFRTVENRPAGAILQASILVVIYAAVMSFFYDWTGLFHQSADRPYLIVAALMIIMMTNGVATALSLSRDETNCSLLKATALLLLAHALGLAAVQMYFNPTFMTSPGGADAILEASQLTDATELGYARAHGTYLTPNGFALAYTLLLLMVVVRHPNKPVSLRGVIVFTVVSIGLATAALSKSMISFGIVTSIVMAVQAYKTNTGLSAVLHGNIKVAVGAAIVAAVGLAVVTNAEHFSSAFRISEDGFADSSYRAQAWDLVLEKFDWMSWVFGTGLSHWQVLFDENLSFRLSDPHTFLLSIPGTFGAVGVVFFLVLIFALAKIAYYSTGSRRILAVSLMTLFLIKDLVSIPYLLGNTPITFLIWILITLVLNPGSADDAAIQANQYHNESILPAAVETGP